MNSQNIFETFNHFLETGDETELLQMADNIEVFGSETFSDGRTYIGEYAPDRFRQTVATLKNSKSKVGLKIKHAILNDDHAIFFLNVLRGRKATGSVLDVVTSEGSLKCFHEVSAKV